MIFLSVSQSYFLSLIYPLFTISSLGHISHPPKRSLLLSLDSLRLTALCTLSSLLTLNCLYENLFSLTLSELKFRNLSLSSKEISVCSNFRISSFNSLREKNSETIFKRRLSQMRMQRMQKIRVFLISSRKFKQLSL